MRRGARFSLVLAIAIVAVAASPSLAGKTRVAKATYAYDMTQGGSLWVSDEDIGITSANTVTFKTTRADGAVELVVTDDSAGAVSAVMWQEGSPAMVFCSQMPSMPITGGQPVYVQMMIEVPLTEANGCATPEVPTTGTVTATFTGAKKTKSGGHHHHH